MITENKKTLFLTKKFNKRIIKKTKVTQFHVERSIERSPLIHGQINLVKFVNLIRYTAKFKTFLFDQIFKKSDVF